jgi:hypothetical protein
LLWVAKTDAEARARSIVTTHEAWGWAIVPVSVKRKVPVELAPQLDVKRYRFLPRSYRRQCCAQPGIDVVIAESLLQSCEGWFSRAVAGSHILDSESITQRRDDPLDLWIGCRNKMKAACNEVNARVDRGCRFEDVIIRRSLATRERSSEQRR